MLPSEINLNHVNVQFYMVRLLSYLNPHNTLSDAQSQYGESYPEEACDSCLLSAWKPPLHFTTATWKRLVQGHHYQRFEFYGSLL